MTWGCYAGPVAKEDLERTIADLHLLENQDTPEHRNQLHVAKQAALKLVEGVGEHQKYHVSLGGYVQENDSYISASLSGNSRT